MEGPTDTIKTGMLSVGIKSVGMFLHNYIYIMVWSTTYTSMKSLIETIKAKIINDNKKYIISIT